MSRNIRLVAVVWGIVVLAAAGSAMADSYLKQVNHTGAFEMMGQPVAAKDDTTVMWIGPDRAATLVGDSATIVYIPGESTVLMIDHTAKTFSKAPASMGDIVDQAMAAEGMEDSEDAKAAKAMMTAMLGQSKASVEATAETKKIDAWQVKKYLVSFSMAMVTFNSEVWATEDIVIDYKMYQDLSSRMMQQMQGTEKLVEEMKKIKGVAVLSTGTMQMMGTSVPTETRLLEFADKPAPAGVYAAPAGYTEVPFKVGE